MRELEKIKKERAAAKAKEEAERAAEEEEQREIDVARGNPLLNAKDFTMKRRWDDDVVFKNQARGTEDRNKKKEFINDMLRSDFHKKFMVCIPSSRRIQLCLIPRDSPNTSDEVITLRKDISFNFRILRIALLALGILAYRFWNLSGRLRENVGYPRSWRIWSNQ
jgi:protein CWC15